jgi:hypothetical protein
MDLLAMVHFWDRVRTVHTVVISAEFIFVSNFKTYEMIQILYCGFKFFFLSQKLSQEGPTTQYPCHQVTPSRWVMMCL